MDSKKMTLSRIAAELGVSVAAVSYALNDRPGVSAELRSRVRQLAKRWNYQSPSPQIALLLPSGSIALSAYGISLLNELRSEAKKRGCRLLMLSCNDLSLLENRMVFGALSVDFQRKMGTLFPRQKDIPLICLNDPGNLMEGVPSVRSDEAAGIRRAMDYLVDAGHRRIALLYFDSPASRDRLEPFLQYERFGIPVERIAQPHSPEISLPDAIASALEQGATALLVSGERYAYPVYHCLAAMGKRIPEDVSLIGVDGIAAGELLDPPLTTMRVPTDQLGIAAVNRLVERIRGLAPGLVKIQVSMELLERGSVLPIRT